MFVATAKKSKMSGVLRGVMSRALVQSPYSQKATLVVGPPRVQMGVVVRINRAQSHALQWTCFDIETSELNDHCLCWALEQFTNDKLTLHFSKCQCT